MAAKTGRPRKYTDKQVSILISEFEKYVEQTDIPIVAEFAYKNNVLRESLYDYQEFSTVLKKCIDKKESQLERLGLSNVVNQAMAIFSLKQLGWKDKQDIAMSGEINNPMSGLTTEELRKMIKDD